MKDKLEEAAILQLEETYHIETKNEFDAITLNLNSVVNEMIEFAKSSEVKDYHQKGLFTEEELKVFARRCWNASDDFREELDRIMSGNSNFDKPHSPNFKQWFDEHKKK